MCRLYVSVDHSPADRRQQLLDAPNGLRRQARAHADGWGVAWFEGGRPRTRHSLGPALTDPALAPAVDELKGPVVLAHVRAASVGSVRLENTHPFSAGEWVFAHNGTVPGFDGLRAQVAALCSPDERTQVRGETDSEWLFALIRTELAHGAALPRAERMLQAISRTIHAVERLCAGRVRQPSTNLLLCSADSFAISCLRRSLFVRRPPGGGVVVASEPDRVHADWVRQPPRALIYADTSGLVVHDRA